MKKLKVKQKSILEINMNYLIMIFFIIFSRPLPHMNDTNPAMFGEKFGPNVI